MFFAASLFHHVGVRPHLVPGSLRTPFAAANLKSDGLVWNRRHGRVLFGWWRRKWSKLSVATLSIGTDRTWARAKVWRIHIVFSA